METAEGLDHRVPQTRRARRAQVGAGPGPGLVEGLSGDRVRKRGQSATVIDGGLCALGLDFVEDLRELRDLRVVEIEPVGEKTQRTPHAEVAAAESERRASSSPAIAKPSGRVRLRAVRAESARLGPLLPQRRAFQWEMNPGYMGPPLAGAIAPDGSTTRGRNASRS